MEQINEEAPDEDPLLTLELLKKIGAIAMPDFTRDTFADDLQGHMWEYPEDAP